MSVMRTMIVVPASAVFVLAGAVAASAHARLLHATPAVGGTVQTPPNELTLHFSERLEPKFSSVVVRDSAGKQVDKGDAHVDKGDRAVMKISLPQLSSGVYTVEWRAVSADTHRVNGNFNFTVAE
jgi:copper resistance protein C